MRWMLPLIAATVALACGDADATGAAAPPPADGQAVYNARCAMCHGRKGDLGLSGAKDLTMSALSRPEAIAIVTAGKGAMMPYGEQLSKKEIEAVVDHVISLRATTPTAP